MNTEQQALVDAIHGVLAADRPLHVIESILQSARTLLNAEAASVFIIDRRRRCLQMAASTNLARRVAETIRVPIGQGVAGWVAEHNESVRVEDVTQDPRHFTGVAQQTGVVTRGYLCVPLAVNGTVLGTIQVLNRHEGGAFSQHDQELLEAFSSIAALAVQKGRLHRQALEKRRIETELAVAQTFQESLLPDTFNPPEPWTISAFNRPARTMGGDIYDGMPLPGKRYLIALGDVSGKGPGAAIWMSGFASALRMLIEMGRDPIDNIGEIDRHLNRLLPMGTFITLFLGILQGTRLRYTSAGHNPMLLMHSDGHSEWLEATGLPLGPMPGLDRDSREVEVPPGARLVLFSDGVSEAENVQAEMYGEERLEAFVRRIRHLPPGLMIDRIVRSVTRFRKGAEMSDDVTLMVIGRDGRQGGS